MCLIWVPLDDLIIGEEHKRTKLPVFTAALIPIFKGAILCKVHFWLGAELRTTELLSGMQKCMETTQQQKHIENAFREPDCV